MVDKTKEAISEVLIQAKMSLDEALTRMQAGEGPGTLTPAQVQRLRALADTNTGCTNTGCGGGIAREVAARPQ